MGQHRLRRRGRCAVTAHRSVLLPGLVWRPRAPQQRLAARVRTHEDVRACLRAAAAGPAGRPVGTYCQSRAASQLSCRHDVRDRVRR